MAPKICKAMEGVTDCSHRFYDIPQPLPPQKWRASDQNEILTRGVRFTCPGAANYKFYLRSMKFQTRINYDLGTEYKIPS